MYNQIILKFNSLKPLEKVILVIGLLISSLIIYNFAPTYFLFIIFGLIIGFFIINSYLTELRLQQELERKYRESLEELSRKPRDLDIYTMVLTLGRKHYKLVTVGSLTPNDQPIIDDLTPIFKAEYERTLNVLRNSPQNSILRKEALEVARIYYSTMRGGVSSIYDEQAISNDLSTIYGSDIDNMSQ